MILNNEYVRISDLFEDAVKRAAQLASLATVLQDAISSQDNSATALSNTAWLLSELLMEQRKLIAELQDAHRKDYISRRDK